VPFTARESFGMLEYWDNERQQRTGVTDYNQGLNMDTLNDSGVAIELIQNKGMGKIELIARNLGNSMGILFEKVLRIAIEFQDRPRNIKVRGEWKSIDMTNMNPEMKVIVQVGLGSGDKVERIKGRMGLLQLQKESMGQGLSDRSKIYENLDGLSRDMDLGDGSKYFNEPTPENEPKPRPDPRVEIEKKKVELKAQSDQANMQLKAKDLEANAALKEQDNQSDAELKSQQNQVNLQLGREKLEMEAMLKREQMEAEFVLKREEMALEFALKRELGINASVGDIEMGGDIG